MVSVIIPYNVDRGYLHEAVESIEAQTYPWVQPIRVKADRSCARNINEGIEHASGDFVKILAEDDILTPDCLEILVKGIQGYDFVYSDGEYFGENYKGIPRSNDKTVTMESMIEKNGINGGTCLYRTGVLRAIGGWDEKLWTAEEYDLHLRLIKAGYKHRHVPGIVYRYRIHPGNKSFTNTSRTRLGRHAYIDQIKQKYEN